MIESILKSMLHSIFNDIKNIGEKISIEHVKCLKQLFSTNLIITYEYDNAHKMGTYTI